MELVRINGITKSFRGNVLFADASFTMKQGRIYGLVGPNGSGKSVLLKIMCGFVNVDAGDVWIEPSFVDGRRSFPDQFGVTIDGPTFLPRLSAFQNLSLLASLRNRIGAETIRETLVAVGLDPDSRQRARNFSLGMKQKLALAQALMESPRVLLLDEPFNALDEPSKDSLIKLLKARRADGTTIMFTSHAREDIEELSDEIYAIENKQLVRRDV